MPADESGMWSVFIGYPLLLGFSRKVKGTPYVETHVSKIRKPEFAAFLAITFLRTAPCDPFGIRWSNCSAAYMVQVCTSSRGFLLPCAT